MSALEPCRLQTPDTQLKASRTALERKSEIYARLAAGNACDDDDEDLYHVDFVRKEPPREGLQQASHAAFGYDYGGGGSGLREGGSGGTGAETRAPDGAALHCCSASSAIHSPWVKLCCCSV